ncbi:MAG: ABC transporter ATP-binding protein [Nitrospirae bacterium]|nr:ABC transporter ATP-binding protein [Nitrospirota bacterium]MCL5236736.1 ABC transporter ATP-binding protein [Nitrospirota bacterium]
MLKDGIMIDIRNVTKTYGIGGQTVKAVDKVSFAMGTGEIVSIIGHSGSGKTTLLSLVGGLTKPDSGSVVIDGKDIWSMDDDSLSELRNRKISFIFQFSSLVPTLTALENIMLPTTFGNYGKDVEGYARELLGLVGLADKADSYPSQLSGGQQRRVAVARAFINRPEVVLADEPTGDLDEETEREVIELFKRMNRERKTAFLLVTHSSELAGQAGRQLRMSSGSVLPFINTVSHRER